MKISFFTIRNQLLFFCLVLFTFLLTADQTKAIPAFSRKYKTSCATCHIAFPKLNAFGEAFRRNGYQFPDGGDPEATKEQPISLGSEGNKKAFPNAIWPGAIPGTTPLAIVLAMETTYSPNEEQKWNFNTLEGEFGALAAGTIGENISFWGQLSIEDDAVEIERVSVILDNIFGGYTATANLKIGKFEPDVYSFSNHRNLGSEYLINTITLGDNMWALEGTQKGLEFNGVIGAGRLGYDLGLVEGSGNLDNGDKDYFVHATYKIGGMRLDGVIPENSAPVIGTQPWEDNSVTIGGFVYRGVASLSDQLKDKFTMIGGDVNLSYGRFNLLAAYAHHNDNNPFIDFPDEKGHLNSYMFEATYIVYPWLIPIARFEGNKANNEPIENNRIAAIIEVLMRANLRFGAEFDWMTQPSPSDPNKAEYNFEELALTITLGF
jgi:hypothetical protein